MIRATCEKKLYFILSQCFFYLLHFQQTTNTEVYRTRFPALASPSSNGRPLLLCCLHIFFPRIIYSHFLTDINTEIINASPKHAFKVIVSAESHATF